MIGGVHLAEGYYDGRAEAKAILKSKVLTHQSTRIAVYKSYIESCNTNIEHTDNELHKLYFEGFLEGLLDFENEFHNNGNNTV